ncbi:MAG: TIGR03067 domain-containing protein [Gemmataceae bacterium]
MTRFSLTFAALILVTGPLAADDKAAIERDTEALQGKWTVSAAYNNGKKLADPDRAGSDTNAFVIQSLTIDGNKIQMLSTESKTIDWVFELEPASTPKVVKFGDAGDPKYYAVYSVEGDTFKICYYHPGLDDRTKLPAKFETKPDDGMYLLEFKRAKK